MQLQNQTIFAILALLSSIILHIGSASGSSDETLSAVLDQQDLESQVSSDDSDSEGSESFNRLARLLP